MRVLQWHHRVLFCRRSYDSVSRARFNMRMQKYQRTVGLVSSCGDRKERTGIKVLSWCPS